MPPLRQWRPLLDAVYEMNTAKDHADFLSAVAAGMSRLIPADLTVVHMLDRKTQRLAVSTSPDNPYTQEEMAFYGANPGGDPLVAYFERTGDQQSRRRSDVMPLKSYLNTPHYIHCQKRLGFIHTLALPVAINKDTVGALSFDRRGTNFTRRHGALLDAFAPHFILAWQRHPDPWIIASKKDEPRRARLQRLGLTAREAEVLYWMTEGKQNREIATILTRSLSTVQEHVANILAKLHQENRTAATVFAIRHLDHPDK
jgi:DNA-binding CsgD family transcriptional regulator